MPKTRKHVGLRKDGKLKKKYRYTGERNKNGTAKIVKVSRTPKLLKGGKEISNRGKCKLQKQIDIENANDMFHQIKKNGYNHANKKLQQTCHNIKLQEEGIYCAKVRNYSCKLRENPDTKPARIID